MSVSDKTYTHVVRSKVVEKIGWVVNVASAVHGGQQKVKLKMRHN